MILWRGIALIPSEFSESMPDALQLKIRQLYTTHLSDEEAVVAAQDMAGFFSLLHEINLEQSHDLGNTDSAHKAS